MVARIVISKACSKSPLENMKKISNTGILFLFFLKFCLLSTSLLEWPSFYFLIINYLFILVVFFFGGGGCLGGGGVFGGWVGGRGKGLYGWSDKTLWTVHWWLWLTIISIFKIIPPLNGMTNVM